MLNSLPVRILWHSLNWLTRLAVVTAATGALLIALLIILLRYWILPDIEQYHDRIAASLSAATGYPVTVGKIRGDWQGFRPYLDFTDVRVLDEQRQPALVLKDINSSVSWMSLFAGELRLASLEIDQPELQIRRDAQGNIFVGGVALSKKSKDNDLADWLLRQSRMVVHDARIIWVDEQRDAVPLVLRQVNLHIENLLNHHRFALRALPPDELATPLDVRGDFHGNSFDDLQAWNGQIFSQFDFTDVTAWQHWLDLPREFSRGRGALRGWLNIEKGKPAGITADLALYNATAKLAADVPEMGLASLRGRVAWQEERNGFMVSTQGLALRLQDGLELRPMDFYMRSAQVDEAQSASIEVRANLLQLETLARLASYMPIDAGLRDRLAAYAPSGKVVDLNMQWQGRPEKRDDHNQPDRFRIKGRFENLAVHQVGKIPGFSGLTMDVDGTDASGRVNINARRMLVEAPGAVREPLPFDTITGQVNWLRNAGELSVNVDEVTVANVDLAGKLHASYQTRRGTLGILDLNANLTRGDISRAARYTPLIALEQEGNDWLNGALQAGHTEDLSIRIKGNLSDFPPGGPNNVLLEIGGHARDAVLKFAQDWPRIENISGEFWIRGNKLEVIAPSASMAGAHLQNVNVSIPDMMSRDLALQIRGEATAASKTFLQFIQKSPVRGYIDGFTDGVSASGNGFLDLSLRIPLAGSKPVKVSGNFRVQDNDIDLGKGVPWLRNARGTVSFTESGMHANGVSAEILGGPASINVMTGAGGQVHATAQGRCNFDVLRGREPQPLLNYLHGGAAWDADINVLNKAAQIVINSNLQGVDSNLPQPFSKRASEAMALHVEKTPLSRDEEEVAGGQNEISAQLGNLVEAHLVTGDEGGVSVIKRGTINFGVLSRKRPSKEGIWLTGNLPELSVQGWGDLTGDTGKSTVALPISGANLTIDKLTGYGQHVNALRIAVAKRGDGLVTRLSSGDLNGEVVWQPHGYKMGGKLSARVRNLQLHKDDRPPEVAAQSNAANTMTRNGKSSDKPGDMPALDIAIENLQVKGKPVGRFELVGYPEGADWRLRRLQIINPDGSLLGEGMWLGNPIRTLSQFNFQFDISDAGKVLERAGYPNTVKGGSGKLAASLSWAGRPDEFNYASLSGTLKLETGNGRFLKMDPGAGKLLSILSLQALPKRLTLDFNDVFREGFQFESINGNATIKAGVVDMQDMRIDGSSAQVTMKGSVDISRETQNLHVQVLPTLGDSMSLIGAFAGGPAVGIGALVVNKVLGNPLDKLVSFEYNVSGTWSEPNVVRTNATPAK